MLHCNSRDTLLGESLVSIIYKADAGTEPIKIKSVHVYTCQALDGEFPVLEDEVASLNDDNGALNDVAGGIDSKVSDVDG